MAANGAIEERVLAMIPQQRPFRFVDRILEVDQSRITADYRFREDEYFYAGHFPGNPVTPGVILIEAMAQAGVVALGIAILLKQGATAAEIAQMTTLFAFAESVEFTGSVAPGEWVRIEGEKMYFRKNNIKTRTSISREDGETVCSGVLAGTGVRLNG
ncbi:MAG: beta-hydroxyacyl-ACP dehydratase [Desulfosalsimonadaceae bacterium]